jgi:hypothetical protein
MLLRGDEVSRALRLAQTTGWREAVDEDPVMSTAFVPVGLP